MKAKKIWLSLILTIAMVVTLLPAMAFAIDSYVARNVDAGKDYSSLRAAISEAKSGDTIEMLDDDRVSFSMDGLEVVINKALTIEGNNCTVYGVNTYNYYDADTGGNDHDIFISGSGDVTIKNLKISEFGGNAYVTKQINPIWTSIGYTGNLTLKNVTIDKFNRTAVNIGGGTVLIDGCTITGDTSPRNVKGAYFQDGIGNMIGDVTIQDTTITGMGAYDPDYPDSCTAGCVQQNYYEQDEQGGQTLRRGSMTIKSGQFSGQYCVISAEGDAGKTAVIRVEGGSFECIDGDILQENEEETVIITGGVFDDPVVWSFASEDTPIATVIDDNDNYLYAVGNAIQEAAKNADVSVIVWQGDYNFDPDTTKAYLANDGNGNVVTKGNEVIKSVEAYTDDALKELNSIDLTAYSEPELTTVKKTVADAKEAIENADTPKKVATALANAKTTVAAQKTDAVKKAEETAAKQKKYAPAKVKLKGAKRSTAKKKRVVFTWKIIKKGVTGYQVQIINKKTGETVVAKSYKQSKKLARRNFIRRAINNKKLKKGKYTVKIRAYKIAEGRRWYGAWSNAKTVKFK